MVKPSVYGTVERCWPGATVVCLASGPSLTIDDVETCRGRAKVIAVKDTIQLAPWADCVYACGDDASRWWPRVGPTLKDFPGLRYTLDRQAAAWATVLRNTGREGLEHQPTGLRIGSRAGSSGYQAINLAVHLGARVIVLLGYDMQADAKGRDHFVGAPAHRARPPLKDFLPGFKTLVQPLKDLGIVIWNCTRSTALTCFQQCPLEQALA